MLWSLYASATAISEPIDAAVLADLRSHFDPDETSAFNELLGLFINHLGPRPAAIRDAVGRADAKAMTAAAHVLRGSSMLVGAHALAELCLQIELAGRSGAAAQAQTVLSLLEDEAVRVRQALAVQAGANAEMKTPASAPGSHR
jgi:HPt (histidine-containing phosphotransfer) domain-containing protein